MPVIDRLIDEVIGKGKYQVVIISVVSTTMIFNALMMTCSVFQAALPVSSRCRIAPYDNETLYPNVTEDRLNRIFIPYDSKAKELSKCTRKLYQDGNTSGLIETENLTNLINLTVEVINCPNGYVYKKGWFTNTLTTEWDLVCDRSILSAISASTYYLGVFFGSILGGIMSDKFGRVCVFRWSCMGSSIFGYAIAFVPSLTLFIILRFFLAVLVFHAVGSSFTYVTEMSKTYQRVSIGMAYNALFGLGCLILSGFAFLLPDWRNLQLAISFWFIPLFVFSWFLPKSPRWLLSQNKIEEAKSSLKKMVRLNRSKFSEVLWATVIKENQEKKQSDKKIKQDEENNKSLLNFFRRPYTRFITWSNMYVWMITCMVYYGLVLSGGTLPGNIFINNAIGGLMDVVSMLIAIPFITKIGCTKTVSISLFVGGGSCIVSTIIVQLSKDLQICATVLSLIGRFFIGMTFATIYLQTVEMFPTVGRTTAFGLASMAARVGAIFSPFTTQLQYNIPWLSPLIYGMTALIAGLFASTFPDTRKTELTATFDEAEQMFRNHLHDTWASRLFCLPEKLQFEEKVEKVPLRENFVA